MNRTSRVVLFVLILVLAIPVADSRGADKKDDKKESIPELLEKKVIVSFHESDFYPCFLYFKTIMSIPLKVSDRAQKEIDKRKPLITLAERNTPLKKVLEIILAQMGKDFTYAVKEDHVLICLKDELETKKKDETRKIDVKKLLKMKIDVSFKKNSLAECFTFFSDMTGLPVKVSEEARAYIKKRNRSVTLNKKNISLEKVLKKVLARAGRKLTFVVKDDHVLVCLKDELKKKK